MQTSGLKQTGGDIVLCAGSRSYLLHRRRVEKKGSRDKNVTFWCWFVGLLAVIARVIQCLMDMQFFCLCACAGEGAALRDGWLWLVRLLVAWWVCWFGRVVAWLVGRLVGTPLMDGCMHGWILCCLTFRRRPGQFPAFPGVPDSLCAVCGGFRRVSNKKLLR